MPVADVAINPLPSATNVVGWYMRQEDGDSDRIWNEVRVGDTSSIYYVWPA